MSKLLARRCVVFCAQFCAAAAITTSPINAQEAEPRLYSNTPVGLNFMIAGHVYATGKMAFDPELRIADADFSQNSGVLAYVRSFALFGQSAKFDLIVPYAGFSAEALVNGQPHSREMSGLGDSRFRVSMNLFGAPAVSAKEFVNYRQDVIIGVSLQVSAPLGQYDSSKLLNLGNNRWSFRPELGISKAWEQWVFEIAASAIFFTENPDFFNGKKFEQAPLYIVRAHLIHNFAAGPWISLDGTYLRGARTTVDGNKGDNEQENVRAGLTFALPIDRQNSVKLNAGMGVYTQTGSQFANIGFAWQYRWGEGY